MVLKPFHVEDPQIDTYQPADPLLKRNARDPRVKEDCFTVLAVIFNDVDFKDPQFDMH